MAATLQGPVLRKVIQPEDKSADVVVDAEDVVPRYVAGLRDCRVGKVMTVNVGQRRPRCDDPDIGHQSSFSDQIGEKAIVETVEGDHGALAVGQDDQFHGFGRRSLRFVQHHLDRCLEPIGNDLPYGMPVWNRVEAAPPPAIVEEFRTTEHVSEGRTLARMFSGEVIDDVRPGFQADPERRP